ncbi:MAG: hypothetical protein ACTSWX_10420 [Promethearchaeota archaeon]
MKKNHLLKIIYLAFILGLLINYNDSSIKKNVNINLETNNIHLKSQLPKKSESAIIADHSIVNRIRYDEIPESAINASKENLHIAYGHTSHGSQLIYGMTDLIPFKENLGGTPGLYEWNDGSIEGELDIDDYFVSGDLGHNGDLTWEASTRTYLDDGNHNDVNVVMWSWCGGVSDNTEAGINTYLNAMNQLELDYPNIHFVYMTGHADGTGDDGNCHIRNQQIRDYCIANNKILFDFYDIECYDPDGNYYGDKNVTDNCDYDSDGNGSLDSNWALNWQNSHTENVDWYDCYCAHSQALNGNQKAYAAWWLWVRLAGWSEIVAPVLSPIVPNPSFTGNITLNWVESQNADNYTIYRDYSYIDGFKSSLNAIGTTEQTHFNDIVTVDAVYYYAICSNNETGSSDLSNCVNVSVEFPNPTPPILELISSNPSNTGEISLNWTLNPNGLHYTIYRFSSLITELNDSVINISQVSTPGYSEKILSQGKFYYVVTTTTVNGTSDISNCVSVLIDFAFKGLLSNYYFIGGASVGILALLGVGIGVFRKKKR